MSTPLDDWRSRRLCMRICGVMHHGVGLYIGLSYIAVYGYVFVVGGQGESCAHALVHARFAVGA